MNDRTETAKPGQGAAASSAWPSLGFDSAYHYWADAWQRSILLLDVLRRRGNNYVEHNARKAPHVLSFDAELVIDGRTLPRPVNYALVRIVPPTGSQSTRTSGPLSFSTRAPGMARGSAA